MNTPNSEDIKVRTRIAPSPTGEYHIGNLRTVLFDYALARKYKGQFIIRIEDTDRKRYVEGAEKRILEIIKAYGIEHDEGPDIGGKFGPYTQSERLEIYNKHAQMLIDTNNAYVCFCTSERLDKLREEQWKNKLPPKYDELCRNLTKEEVEKRIKNGEKHVIRHKIPHDQVVKVRDEITGESTINTNDLDDYILVKSDGFPTYHLAAIVDDHLMEITHVFRGVEWKPSLPKNILLFKAFGWKTPKYIHPSVILNSEKPGKLSKRDGSVSAISFLIEGYLPEAMLNFLMLLGWAPKDNREIYSLEEFVQAFDIDGLQSSSPKFNRVKLEWINGQYIMKLSEKELTKRFSNWINQYYSEDNSLKTKILESANSASNELEQILTLLQTRAKTFSDMLKMMKFFFVDPTYELKIGEIKELKSYDIEILKSVVSKLIDVINDLGSVNNWSHETWEAKIRSLADDLSMKHGDMFMLLRIALVADRFSPPLYESMVIIGEDRIIKRLKDYLTSLN